MIAYITGKIVHREPAFVIIDVNGIGYQAKISLNTYSVIKDLDQCKLITWMHIKEDAHTLYGFSSISEKKLFLDLVSVSGVGPSIGLTILSSLTAAEIYTAITNEQAHVIQAVKGVGAKTAQRIILELKDKLKKDALGDKSTDLTSVPHNTLRNEALSALLTLGINKGAAEKSIDMILKSATKELSLEDLIKLSLKTQ